MQTSDTPNHLQILEVKLPHPSISRYVVLATVTVNVPNTHAVCVVMNYLFVGRYGEKSRGVGLTG